MLSQGTVVALVMNDIVSFCMQYTFRKTLKSLTLSTVCTVYCSKISVNVYVLTGFERYFHASDDVTYNCYSYNN